MDNEEFLEEEEDKSFFEVKEVPGDIPPVSRAAFDQLQLKVEGLNNRLDALLGDLQSLRKITYLNRSIAEEKLDKMQESIDQIYLDIQGID